MNRLLRRFIYVSVFLVHASTAFADDGDTPAEDDWMEMDGEGITVTREPPVSAQTKTISREDIDALNGTDVLSILEQALGLSVTRAGGYGNAAGFSLRGFGSGRVAILVDGMPVNSPQSGSFDLSIIDPSTIDKIEIVYGGSDSRFGASGAIGGTINIVTKSNVKKGIGVSFGASNLSQIPAPEVQDFVDTQNANVSVHGGNGKTGWSLGAFANRAGNAFRFDDGYGNELRRDGNLILDSGATTSLSVSLPSSSSLDLYLSAYGAHRNIPGILYSATSGEQTDFTLTDRARLDLRRAGSDRLGTEIDVMHTLTDTSWEDATTSSSHRLHTASLVNRWNYFAWDAIQLTAGGDARYSHLSSTNTGTVSGADGGINAAAEWFATEFLTWTPSVRLVLSKSGAVPVPRLGVRWAPSANSKIEVKHNAFRVYKLPNFNDLYWSGDATAKGNPDLKSEDGAGVDTIVTWNKNGDISVEGSAYASWHANAIQWQTSNGVWSPGNIGEALFLGFDANVRARIRERFRVDLLWSWLDTRVLTGDIDFPDAKRIPYQPMNRLNLDAAWSAPDTELCVRAHYESERFTTVVNVARLEPFFTLDASVSRTFGDDWTAYVDAKNILGASYVTVEGYPMPGASVTIGFKTSYGAR